MGLIKFLQSWDILLINCNNQFKKVYNTLANTSEGDLLHSPSDVYVRSFLCPFCYFNKTLLHKSSWVIQPGPWSRSYIFFLEIMKSNIVHCKISVVLPLLQSKKVDGSWSEHRAASYPTDPRMGIYLFIFLISSLMNFQLSLRKTGIVVFPLVASGFCSIMEMIWWLESSFCSLQKLQLPSPQPALGRKFSLVSTFPQIFLWGQF